MQQTISSIFFLGYRRRGFGLLCLHPDAALREREIERHSDLPSGTVTRELVRPA